MSKVQRCGVPPIVQCVHTYHRATGGAVVDDIVAGSCSSCKSFIALPPRKKGKRRRHDKDGSCRNDKAKPKQTFPRTTSTEQVHAIRVYDADMRITRDRWSSFRHNI